MSERNVELCKRIHAGNLEVLLRDLRKSIAGGHSVEPVLGMMESEIRALRKAAIVELVAAATEAHDCIDRKFGPPGSNNLDAPLLHRLRAALAGVGDKETR